MTTGYLYLPVFLEHQEFGHPESPERLTAILHTLEETGLLARLTALEPLPSTDAQIEAAHTRDHLARVKSLIARGGGHFDADTYANARSLDAALLAAGALTRAVDAVLAGEVDNAFACVRPPGHHATRTRAMGFCIFNNIYLISKMKFLSQRIFGTFSVVKIRMRNYWACSSKSELLCVPRLTPSLSS